MSVRHLGLDQIMAEAEAWRERHPWKVRMYAVRRWFSNLWDLRLVPRRKWERAQKGYSYYDWWSFDTYIAGVVGQACVDFREKAHGYPMDMTEDEWRDILIAISEPLLRYSEEKFSVLPHEEQEEIYKAACEAMKLFGEHLGGMWD